MVAFRDSVLCGDLGFLLRDYTRYFRMSSPSNLELQLHGYYIEYPRCKVLLIYLSVFTESQNFTFGDKH